MKKLGFQRLLAVMGLLVIVLLAAAFVLGILSLRRTQEIVSDDFQSQQLILARATARQLEDGLAFLRRELRTLAYSPAIQYLEDVAWANRMRLSFEELSRLGVTAIVRLNAAADQAYTLDAGGPRVAPGDFRGLPAVAWAKDPANRGRSYQGPIRVEARDGVQVPVMELVTPVYGESVDESHPRPPGGLTGVLLFKIDLSRFVGSYCAGIRSGRTGYCWVINQAGLFLYHPERDFIGRDAFTARGRRNPLIDFGAINEIQRSRMAAGEEGASRYTSGWHRGVIGQMEKFLAYAPARAGPDGGPIWSVAVVAPTDEVYGTIHSLYVRQFLIQGLLIFALICAAAAIIYYTSRWSVELQEEVDRTTADLRRSQKQYRSVVENARDLIFLLDEAGAFISANHAAARVLGIPAVGLQGRNLADFFDPEALGPMSAAVAEVFSSRLSVEIKQAIVLRERTYWFSIHFVPIFGEDGRSVEQVLVMARDITERQEMEKQLAQTEKLASLGTLAAGVAHEINNPVGVMLGFTELLLDRLPPDSQEHQMLKTIERQGLNARKIVENMMSFARLPSGQEEFTDLNRGLENVVELVKNHLLTRKIELEVRLAPDLPKVRGDAGELQQVFFNLINNAVAAMPGGGRLTVITKINPYTNLVEAIFADTGSGIPQEIGDRIFDPFFTTKKVGEGTGLGLAVSYAIISKYGGNIRFESRTAGEAAGGSTGTTFFIILQPETAAAHSTEARQAAN